MTWAEWTKAGLVDRYEVPADKVVVIPPGRRLRALGGRTGARAQPTADGPVRVLFVGGDLARKGGLRAPRRGAPAARERRRRRARPRHPRRRARHGAGITVHHGLAPNSPALIELYHRADVFCLPTLGDCLPMVLSEAGAVGLPLVSTDVGAIREIVRDGETGLLVPVGDAEALAAALRRLADDPDAAPARWATQARRVVARPSSTPATNAAPARRPARSPSPAGGRRR